MKCLVVMQVAGVPTEAASLAVVPMAVASLVVVASVAVVAVLMVVEVFRVAGIMAVVRASGRARRSRRLSVEPALIEP